LAFIKFAFTFTSFSGSFTIYFIAEMWVEALMAFFPAIHILEGAFVAEFRTSNTLWFRLRYWLVDDIFIAENVIKALETISPAVEVCGITHAHAVNLIHGTIVATIIASIVATIVATIVASIVASIVFTFTVATATSAAHLHGVELICIIVSAPAWIICILVASIAISICKLTVCV
jgi:hypothetical protein